eukprot:1159836-Pelagomonas_calceolata.AAC.3
MQDFRGFSRGGQASGSGRPACAAPQVAALPRNARMMQRSLKRQGLVVSAFTHTQYAPIPARKLSNDDMEEELPLWQQSTEQLDILGRACTKHETLSFFGTRVNAVDDHRLRNPLLRAERLGTGWFGVICEVSAGPSVCGEQMAH